MITKNELFKTVISFFVLISVCQLLNTSCTKRLQPAPPTPDIDLRAESPKLSEIKNLHIDTLNDDISTIKTIQPGPSAFNIESHGQNKKLKVFLDGGIEKATANDKATAREIIATARKYLGVPHCMGGTSMKCIDCSGFIFTVFAAHGINLPHNSEELARYGKLIPRAQELVMGDLVFFINSYKSPHFITHSGICIGNNEFIHSSSGSGVTITSLDDPYWKEKFIFGTRVLK